VVLDSGLEKKADHLKILFYNWTDYQDPDQRGGGVSVYQKNLIEAATQCGDEVWFLSSGTAYSPFAWQPFIRELPKRRFVRRFEFVNSAIMSPGHLSFGQDVTASPVMEDRFSRFLSQYGPFDVVHFNNLEGIPVSFLRLAREHSKDARIVYSIHNYYAFCPQVNLWFQEKASCRDFRDGRKCVNCLITQPAVRGLRWRYRVEYCLHRLGVSPYSSIGRFLRSLVLEPARVGYRAVKLGLQALSSSTSGALPAARVATGERIGLLDGASAFARRRQEFVAALNRYADRILAVSARVAEIAENHGVDPVKLSTLYIGTKFAARAAASYGSRHEGKMMDEGMSGKMRSLRLVYLGYMRRDKGFYFFLDALTKMPASLARRLQLTFATKVSDPFSYARIKWMAHRFDSVTFYNGYTHTRLPQILQGADLGVVPVLWEDNLPQVAIECVASGVPILTSDRGGARELLDCPALVFKAGSYSDFFAKIASVLQNPALLGSALANRRTLYTPEQHYERLRSEVYRQPKVAPQDKHELMDYALTHAL
jgi:glycosyltransferase involved in cell wall biosynthesis